ncbi:U32 family peptidase [Patescibacteria group bacterium]|nr:U32 family peptidase [Patescibacteria group bacterium]
MGVDYVTLANPLLIDFVLKHFPDLKVVISVCANTDSLQKVEYWEDRGVHGIVLSKRLNKDFGSLEQIANNSSVKLQVIANDLCIPDCPLNTYHNLVSSFGSRSAHDGSCYPHQSYATLSCRLVMLLDPSAIIRGPMIRPEDVHHYVDVGINVFKLVDRTSPTNFLQLVMDAYGSASYDGNFADLCSFFVQQKVEEPDFSGPRIIKEDELNNLASLERLKNHLRFTPYIDNKTLDGQIDFVKKNDCTRRSCSKCGFCNKLAHKAVTIDSQVKKIVEGNIRRAIDLLISGR